METAMVKADQKITGGLSVFGAQFEDAQRMAKAISTSSLVPKEYQGADKIGNILIALELAQRTDASPLMVMQNLYIVHGKPSWSGQFIIAAINASGKFSPLRFEQCGTAGKPDWGMRAWATENATGEKLFSPWVTMAMAQAEGWVDKNGSKWKTMPELMLHYRSATFFGRLYAPEVLMGMKVEGEIEDVDYEEIKQPSADRFRKSINPEPAASGGAEIVDPDSGEILSPVMQAYEALLLRFKAKKIGQPVVFRHTGKQDQTELTQSDIDILTDICAAIEAGTLTGLKAFTPDNIGKTKEQILFPEA